MHLHGVVLDIYDDPKASILLEKLAGQPLPEALGNSDLLDRVHLDALPDRLFGLVAFNGGETLRKFAMHDPAHTTTSVLYFLETGHLLPASAQKVAAANLLRSCEDYGIHAPAQLEKVAIGVGTVTNLAGELTGVNEVGRTIKGAPQAARNTQAGFNAAQSGLTSDQIPKIGSAKQADLTGTEMMPIAGSISTLPYEKNTAKINTSSSSSKRASWQHAGDITRHRSTQKVAQMTSKYAMPTYQTYPIDSYAEIKTAAAYFDEHMESFRLEDRREFAVSLGNRMEELGLPLTENLMKYAGHEYGPYVDVELHARVRNYEGTGFEDAYSVLLEKRAAVPPHVMLEALHEFDVVSGADKHYNSTLGFRDPFQAVYGKVAAEEKPWTWSEGNEYVTDGMLKDLAMNRYPSLDRAFGMDVRKSFQQDPIGVFSSMPDPQKVVIARLAADDSKG